MDVILLERVEKLGQIGDVVTVKNGFARNFLLPNKKALRANAANKKLFEANRAKIESDNADRRVEAEAASKDVDGKTVQLIRQASNTGQLYGSVSARDIVEALETEGAKVLKSQVVLGRPAVGAILLRKPVGHALVLAASGDGRNFDRGLEQSQRLGLPFGRQFGRLGDRIGGESGGCG